MVAGDTIRLLTRYNVGAARDPRENRLTAALVALLSESPALATRVACDWVRKDARSVGTVRPTLQRPVGGRVGWVDFELDIEGPPHTVIWVEVKLGQRLSGANQLSKYRERLLERHPVAERFVLLLAPGQRRSVFANVPSLADRKRRDDLGPFFVAWQDVYWALREGGQQALGKAHVKWLLEEVLAYMASEDLKLTPLKGKHVAALTNSDEAQGALGAVLDRAVAHVARGGHWKKLDSRERWENYWEYRYSPPAIKRRGTKAILAWGVAPPEIFAGVYFERDVGEPVRPKADEAWMSLLNTNVEGNPRWSADDSDRRRHWIGRTMSLSDLVREAGSPDDQAKVVASFVMATFSDLTSVRTQARS